MIRGATVAAVAPFFYGATMSNDSLIETLPPPWRLALAYAPASTRARWLTLLAFDVRLSGVVRAAREPILAQMRLAWWRDRLGDRAENWPRGEPLLAALGAWDGEHGALLGLVDGWEAVLGEGDAALSLAQGRAQACLALGRGEAVERMARGWGLADLAAHSAHPALDAALSQHDWRGGRLPRGLRPLVVLHGMAARGDKTSKISLLRLIRLGLIGV